MALVLNEFGIRGRVGNVVFCKLNGKSYMRSLPDRIDPNTETTGSEIPFPGGRAFLQEDKGDSLEGYFGSFG